MSSPLSDIGAIFSGGISIVLKLLGFQYPTLMAATFCLAFVLQGLAELFQIGVASELDYLFFFSISYLFFFYKMWIRYLLPSKGAVLNEATEKVFAALKKTFDDGKIPLAERKIFYSLIAKHTVNSLNISADLKEEMQQESRLAEQQENP